MSMKAKESEDYDSMLEGQKKGSIIVDLKKNTITVISIMGKNVYTMNSLAKELKTVISEEQFKLMASKHLYSLIQ